MGIDKLNEGEIQDLSKKVLSLSGYAAKQALLGCVQYFRHFAALRNGFFVSIVDDAILLAKSEEQKSHES